MRYGHWNKNDNGTYSCSICQSWIPKEQHYYARYCLHCGARMESETIPIEWIKKWKEKAADGSLYRGPLDLYDHCEYEAAIDRLLSDWGEENAKID